MLGLPVADSDRVGVCAPGEELRRAKRLGLLPPSAPIVTMADFAPPQAGGDDQPAGDNDVAVEEEELEEELEEEMEEVRSDCVASGPLGLDLAGLSSPSAAAGGNRRGRGLLTVNGSNYAKRCITTSL